MPEGRLSREVNRLARIAVIAGAIGGIGPEQDRYKAHAQEPEVDDPRGTITVTSDPYTEESRERNLEELETMLDSTLITYRVEPGTPFEDRVGEVDDPRVLEIMRDIDDTLGGRIEWPNVYVVQGLELESGAMGTYRTFNHGEGETAHPSVNRGIHGADRAGIALDKGVVDRELGTGTPSARISVRNLIVHELQHATSWDNKTALRSTAERSGYSYEHEYSPASESRADLAMLVESEMRQRRDAGGPKLNELSVEERREVVAETLSQFLTPENRASPSQEEVEARLSMALRDQAYLQFGDNYVWNEARDNRTERYIHGVDDRAGQAPELFVPTGMDREERLEQLATPLDELAEQYKDKRESRVQDHDEWLRQGGQDLEEPRRERSERGDTSPRQDARSESRTERASEAPSLKDTLRDAQAARSNGDGRSSQDGARAGHRTALQAALAQTGHHNEARPKPAPSAEPGGGRTPTLPTAPEPPATPPAPARGAALAAQQGRDSASPDR